MIVISEAWTPKKKSNRKAPMIKNYQTYNEMQVTTTKGGCGFYAKQELKNKPGKNLDQIYHNKDDEFQKVEIEILNNKKLYMIIGL